MARLSNVPLDWMQTEELLKQKLSQADYTDGFTAYARSQQKSSLKRQGAYIVLKGPSQRGTNNVYAWYENQGETISRPYYEGYNGL